MHACLLALAARQAHGFVVLWILCCAQSSKLHRESVVACCLRSVLWADTVLSPALRLLVIVRSTSYVLHHKCLIAQLMLCPARG